MTIDELFPGICMEDKEVEFKGILSKGKDDKGNSLEMDWLKTIAAFANGEGGRLFIGVENKSHKIVALDANEADRQVLLLHQEIRNRFDPVIYPEVKKHMMPWKGHNILLEVVVSHSPLLPVFVSDRGAHFTFVRRFGETNVASSEEIRQLVMSSEDVSFDQIPTSVEFREEDFVDMEKLYFENRGEKLSLNTLLLKGFVDGKGFLRRGALLFRDDTKSDLTSISIVKYTGFDKGSDSLVFVKRMKGPIHRMILDAKECVMGLSPSGLQKTNDGEKILYSYPERSVLEAIANAFAHRNYWMDGTQIQVSLFPDRLEVTSPGSLPGIASLDKDKEISQIKPRHRNKIIADILMVLGLVQGLGTGFGKIADDYAAQDEDHKPFIDSDANSFTITLPNLLHKEGVLDKGDIVPKVRTDKRLLDENEQRILGYCFYNRHSIKEIADYLGVSVSTYLSKRILSPLVSEGLLIETSSRPKTFMSDRTNVQVF